MHAHRIRFLLLFAIYEFMIWFDVVLLWYDLLYKMFYFNLDKVMFVELCDFVYGYDQRIVKDDMDGHNASSDFL